MGKLQASLVCRYELCECELLGLHVCSHVTITSSTFQVCQHHGFNTLDAASTITRLDSDRVLNPIGFVPSSSLAEHLATP
jgi:hypothetical protein